MKIIGLLEHLINFSRGKEAYIYIDENIEGIENMLLSMGLENVYKFPDGTNDMFIHQSINKKHRDYNPSNKTQKPVLFITKNIRDFTMDIGKHRRKPLQRNYTAIYMDGRFKLEDIAKAIYRIVYFDNKILRKFMLKGIGRFSDEYIKESLNVCLPFNNKIKRLFIKNIK